MAFDRLYLGQVVDGPVVRGDVQERDALVEVSADHKALDHRQAGDHDGAVVEGGRLQSGPRPAMRLQPRSPCD